MRKINCQLTKNLKDNHDMWVAVLQQEAAAAAQQDQDQLNGPEPPVSSCVGVHPNGLFYQFSSFCQRTVQCWFEKKTVCVRVCFNAVSFLSVTLHKSAAINFVFV